MLTVSCPICKKKVVYEGNTFRPFCSEKCKRIDLGTWASDGYVIQGKNTEVDEDNVSTEESDSQSDYFQK